MGLTALLRNFLTPTLPCKAQRLEGVSHGGANEIASWTILRDAMLRIALEHEATGFGGGIRLIDSPSQRPRVGGRGETVLSDFNNLRRHFRAVPALNAEAAVARRLLEVRTWLVIISTNNIRSTADLARNCRFFLNQCVPGPRPAACAAPSGTPRDLINRIPYHTKSRLIDSWCHSRRMRGSRSGSRLTPSPASGTPGLPVRPSVCRE